MPDHAVPIQSHRRRCPRCGRIASTDRAGYCWLCAARDAGLPDAALGEMVVLLPGQDAMEAMRRVLGIEL